MPTRMTPPMPFFVPPKRRAPEDRPRVPAPEPPQRREQSADTPRRKEAPDRGVVIIPIIEPEES